MTLQLDQDDLHRLLEKISNSDIQEFSLEGEDFRLKLKRNIASQIQESQISDISLNQNQIPISSPSVLNIDSRLAQPSTPSTQQQPPSVPGSKSEFKEITAPMVGTFYRASAPGEGPFVEVGTSIKVGQTVCILEAMKLMNEIESEFNAEVIEILVENGTPVEFGQALMKVKPL
tara:strand:+ start:6480 stop:7001 length:522 start_codon:yes stop_codon:yes gene_type:complete